MEETRRETRDSWGREEGGSLKSGERLRDRKRMTVARVRVHPHLSLVSKMLKMRWFSI